MDLSVVFIKEHVLQRQSQSTGSQESEWNIQCQSRRV